MPDQPPPSPTSPDVDQLVEHAQSLLGVLSEAARRKKRRLFKVGQKSRRSNGQYFVKTDRGWRRVAKNPRKAPTGWMAPLLAKAVQVLSPILSRLPDGRKPGKVRAGEDLFRKGTRTKSPKPKRRRGSPLPKAKPSTAWGRT